MKPIQFSQKYLILIICVLFFSCSKKNESEQMPVATGPTITSLNVTQGSYNTRVIITGTGFDAKPANNQIFFNTKSAIIIAATTTTLTTLVPLNAGTGNVTVNVNGMTVAGPIFNYQTTLVVTTIAGNANIGSSNGLNTAATFFQPEAITTDTYGNLYVADTGNGLIRKITSTGIVSTLAGSGTKGYADGIGTAASFSSPNAIAIDASGNLYAADRDNARIRKISSSGVVTTITGGALPRLTDPTTGLQLNYSIVEGIAVDANGNVFLTDSANGLILKINSVGQISVFAKNGILFSPNGITIDNAGNLYVTSQSDNSIIKFTASGLASTYSKGAAGFLTGTNVSAQYNTPSGITVDISGNIYVADFLNFVIKKVTATGIISVFAGNGNQGNLDGISTQANFIGPTGITVDASNNVFVNEGNIIRKISFE